MPPETRHSPPTANDHQSPTVDGAVPSALPGLSGQWPEYRLRAADPENHQRTDTVTAGRAFMVITLGLALAALMNSSTLLQGAKTSEVGLGRDVAIGVLSPLEAVGSGVGLTAPRSGLDSITQSTIESIKPPPHLPQSQVMSTRDSQGTENRGLSDALETPYSSDVAELLGDGSGDGRSMSTTSAPDNADRNPPNDPEINAESMLRTPTPSDPLRILIVGDSIVDAVGNSVLRHLSETGVTDAKLDFRVSTGLVRPDYFDWPSHLRSLRAEYNTEVVVIMLGANDAQAFLGEESIVEFGSDRWLGIYQTRVAALLNELTLDNGWVVVVGQPIMREKKFDAKMNTISQIYADEASYLDRAVFVDSRTALSLDGAYTPSLNDADGNRQQIRLSDGIHLTPSGGDQLAPHIVEAINSFAPLGP